MVYSFINYNLSICFHYAKLLDFIAQKHQGFAEVICTSMVIVLLRGCIAAVENVDVRRGIV
jgi:hypothetical protein